MRALRKICQDFGRAMPRSTGARAWAGARLTVCWVGVSSPPGGRSSPVVAQGPAPCQARSTRTGTSCRSQIRMIRWARAEVRSWVRPGGRAQRELVVAHANDDLASARARDGRRVGGRRGCADAGAARTPEVRGRRRCADAGGARTPEVRGRRRCSVIPTHVRFLGPLDSRRSSARTRPLDEPRRPRSEVLLA
jgi:hypothetical protein